MPRVVLASALARWLPPSVTGGDGEFALAVPGGSVAEVLEGVFSLHPLLRGYVLDERGVPRRHVALFVDGTALQPKTDLARALRANSELYVMQALSGG